MSRVLTGIEYRQGMLSGGMSPAGLPFTVWRDAEISQEVRDAVVRENLLDLGGVYGDKEDATPVEYDLLRLVSADDVVEIEVFNRGFALLTTDDEELRRIDRVLALLGKERPGSGSEVPQAERSGIPDATAVPAPDDLAGWKEADRRLCRRFADHVRYEDRLYSSRPVTRYFGVDDLEYFIGEHESRGAGCAYAAWGILDYRPTRKSKTHAEKMLEKGLPEPEAILLRARIDTAPTLYRVAGHDAKAGTLDLEDVLLGGAVTAQDQLMSESIEDGVFIVARAFPAGRFRFLELAGPPLGAGMALEAIEFLKDEGMEFTREGLRRDSHMFGWLWDWADEWEANWKPPRIQNTDGDEFLWHTASFSVADQADTRLKLIGRGDIDHDEKGDTFVWFKEAGRGDKLPGGPTVLGKIEFFGDELVLETNSAERFAAARKWLEEMPGVVFRNVTTRRWDEADTDRPLDERISKPEDVEVTPEMVSAVQEMVEKYCMEWLDTLLPILEDKSPRQACRTPAGRRQVTTLIRTMPDPMGQAGSVKVPREAMLQELGLPVEPSGAASGPGAHTFSEQTHPLSSGKKVGRNEPCPCGSGKKYKKCCGR